MTRYERVADSRVHEEPRAPQSLAADSRVVFQEVPHPLFVNLVGPTGLKQASLREAHYEIADRGGVKDASVYNCSGSGNHQ